MERYNHKEVEEKWQNKWDSEKIFQASEDYSKQKDLWLIWDHPDQINKINGIKTNNKEYAILLIQKLSELNGYSEKLHNTDYYSFGDKEYYNNIVKNRL